MLKYKMISWDITCM